MLYLHVGNNKNIRTKAIIGIFDADSATVSEITKKYLTNAEKQALVESAVEEIPKSFILYRENDSYKICFSQLSVTALISRAEI